MSRAAILILLALSGCTRPSYEQIRTVQEACHTAGMDSAVRGEQIICWVKP